MKKLLIFALALAMIFALSACGEKAGPSPSGGGTSDTGVSQQTQPGSGTSGSGTSGSAPSGSSDAASDIGDIDLGSIMAGETGTLLSQLPADQKAALINQAKIDGVELSFNSDGSTTIKEPDGSVTIQKADGTWIYRDAEGGEAQYGGNWPDNEYTKMLPKPDFAVLASSFDDSGLGMVFSDATEEQIKAYVETLKSAGFTLNAETVDEEFYGVAVYSYTASNAAGYTIDVTSSGGVSSLSVYKN